MSRNRYPGVRPFESDQRSLFFGRDRDIAQLHEMILLEKLVVLFGKSGYGKSSLLNAGVVPRFTEPPADSPEYYRPIQVRFGNYQEGQNDTPPVAVIRRRLDAQCKPLPENDYLDDLAPASSLWTEFKRRQDASNTRFLLVFDQFEELASYPIAQQAAFKRQLAELLYVTVPQPIRDRADELDDAAYDRLFEKLDVKAVFAIRSDRLSFLDALSDALPAILQKRYELQALQREQAQEAILNPAALAGDFLSPPFTYSPEALELILANLSSREPGQTGIEAFQLQVICQYLERQVREGVITQDGHLRIEEADLPDLSNIYEAYYKQQVSLLAPDQRRAARLLIEEGLLSISEETGEARRMSVDGRALLDRYRQDGVRESLLNALVDAFLLRREPNTTGGFNYEISHDTLLRPIARSRAESRAAEEARQQEIARKEAEAKAAEERRRREEAERLQELAEANARKARFRTWVAGIIALAAIGLLVWALFQRQKAIRNEKLAQDRQIESDSLRLEAEGLLGQVQDEQAKTQQALEETTAAQQAALAEKERAERLRKLADDQKEQAIAALAEVERTTAQIVEFLLQDADELILNLQYEEALQKIKLAAELNQRKSRVITRFQEIAYVFTETGQTDRAMGLLDTLTRLAGREDLRDQYLQLTSDAKPGPESLRPLVRAFAPGNYEQYEKRYYPEMVFVEGGSFRMGSEDGLDNERPVHDVTLDDYWMARTETTVWQYYLFATATNRVFPEEPSWGWLGDNPMMRVSWNDALAYANWVSGQQGRDTVYQLAFPDDPNALHEREVDWGKAANWSAKGYRLPTEAEWEYAARGGKGGWTDQFTYAGSNTVDEVAWYRENSGSRTQAVGTKKANQLGLYDMTGNVWEWCWDWKGRYPSEPQTDPKGPDSGNYRVLRGGSWVNDDYDCRVTNRSYSYPNSWGDYSGFRLTRY